MSLFKKRHASAAATTELTGERRQLTVLFYDIVGSTSLTGGDDPETLRHTLDLIHAAARETFLAQGGSLEQIMGDGGMAYFGYPLPSEDAALSAVTAALELLAKRQDISAAPNIRIGIATSVVVLPDSPEALGAGRLGAVGVAPNLAARLESAAGTNQILVAPSTYALTHRAVEYGPVDDLDLKGFPDVSRAWSPTALYPIASRFQRDRDASGAFTGRSTEISALKDAWESTKSDAGTAILIEGEPGIGKSRILAELVETATEARTLLLQCQPRTEGEALFSVINMYDRAYEDGSDVPLCDAALRTANNLAELEENEALSAHARREGILSAVIDELLDLAQQKPLILLAEDLHWADEVTLAMLDRLGSKANQSALLVVATSRPDAGFHAVKSTFRPLALSPLTQKDAHTLINITAHTPLPPSTCDWIVERADGNPLFLNELTAFVSEALAAGQALSDISGANIGTLHDLLSSRLENSGVAKRTAQIASVLGREFPYHILLRLISSYDKELLDADLQRLVDHGLTDIISNGYSYAFRHALIRDVAYDSQLRAVRKKLHGAIVDLVDADPILTEAIPNIFLAEHCLAADRTERGIELLLSVAEDAIRLSALQSPCAMLKRVLLLAETLPKGTARDLIELRAITLLGPLITLLEGPRAAAPLYERGQALYFALPERQRESFFPVLWGWWFTASSLGEQSRRSEILIRDVTPEKDPESRLQALHCGWATLFDGGAHDRCLSTISDGLALYDPEVGQHSRYLYGHDAKVCGLGERALSAWLTGQLELSADAAAGCENWADDTAHLASQLHGLDIATQVAFFRHDLVEVDRVLSKMANLSDADAVPAITAKRQIFRSWMAARQGDTGQMEAVNKGLEALRGFGVLEDVPFYADIAADVASASGSVEAALGPLNAAIDEARSTGLTYWLPELLRRKARLVQGPAAALALEDGFEVAVGQNARMLLLRNAATRLDLGLAFPTEHKHKLQEAIRHVSECALRQKVLDALAL